MSIIQMEPAPYFAFPVKKIFPISLVFGDGKQPSDVSSEFVNPFLGYPNCPLLARYNRNEYHISQIISHLQFNCLWSQVSRQYECQHRTIRLPETIRKNLRAIPEIIPINKPAAVKNSPTQHPITFPVSPALTFTWVISSGQLANDFFNYLNHTYALGHLLFQEEKLKKQVYFLPICAYVPLQKGMLSEEVEKGISMEHFRGQYMSLHISKGAPAFSPNNMRLGLCGESKVKKAKNKYVQKRQAKSKKPVQQVHDPNYLDWEQMQKKCTISQKIEAKEVLMPKKVEQETRNRNLSFFTSVLLEKDYRVYYHWHIEDAKTAQLIQQMLEKAPHLQDFIVNYKKTFGVDRLFEQLVGTFQLQL